MTQASVCQQHLQLKFQKGFKICPWVIDTHAVVGQLRIVQDASPLNRRVALKSEEANAFAWRNTA